jgi:allophanate hydrolase
MNALVSRVEAAYARINEVDRPEVWIDLRARADVLADAEEVTRRLEAGEELPLAGLLAAVKGNIDVAGLPTTAGCPAFAYSPERDATAVARLRAAGALVLGTTNLDQFATGLVGTRSPYGAVRHATAPERISGGSSSGSAVAVALGIVDVALGTDTAGSGRVPAAFHGLVGIKATRGVVPATGVVPACRSLDCVTVLARNLFVARRTLLALAGPDGVDPLARDLPPGWASVRRGGADGGPPVVAVPALDALGRLAPGWSGRSSARRPRPGARALRGHGPAGRAGPGRPHGARGHGRLAAPDDDAAPHPRRGRGGPGGRELRPGPVHQLREPPGHGCAGDTSGEGGRAAVRGAARGAGVQRRPARGCSRASRGGLGPDAAGTGPAARIPRASVPLAVVGAHLSGQPLNHQLVDRGGRLIAATTTAPAYRLFALDTIPAKPGLVRVADGGAPIKAEVWELPTTGFGDFVASVPAPMTIGKVLLADGSEVPGFLCEPAALDGVRDITASGGWLAHLVADVGAPTSGR